MRAMDGSEIPTQLLAICNIPANGIFIWPLHEWMTEFMHIRRERQANAYVTIDELLPSLAPGQSEQLGTVVGLTDYLPKTLAGDPI